MNQTNVDRPFRVLSLDGGGMRGLYTTTLLGTLASALRQDGKVDIGTAFDLIVGTSTGGILGTALAVGRPIEEVSRLYRDIGPRIFTDSQPSPNLAELSNLKPAANMGPLRKLWWAWRAYKKAQRDPFVSWCQRNLTKAANSPDALRAELTRLFGNTTFGELFKSRGIGLCLTAVKILDEKFRVFKTPHIPDKVWDIDLPLVEACLATSAAPIFLPLAGFAAPRQEGLIEFFADGGLAANNPVLVGLIDALHMVGNAQREIQIFSVGTCSAPEGTVLQEADKNRGLGQWQMGAKALGLSMNAQASASDFAVKHLAKWFTEHCRQKVHVVRFPEEPRSQSHLQFLRMDNASKECCQAFMSFGNDDAMAAKRLCDSKTPDGMMIIETFNAMKLLPPAAP